VVLIIALSSPDGTNDFLMALTEVLRKAGVEQADFRREGVRRLAEDWMEMELADRLPEYMDTERARKNQVQIVVLCTLAYDDLADVNFG
jgi:hypothetical protein